MRRPLSVRLRRSLGIALSPVEAARWLARGGATARARRYLDAAGVLAPIERSQDPEMPAQLGDLANLHRLVRRRRPGVVLEFGPGYSTIVIAHALSLNTDEDRRRGAMLAQPRLWSVEANAHWLETARARLPASLAPLVEFWHSPVRAHLMDGRLVSLFDRLPNIVPDFIYLDGPDPRDIEGEVHGLSFTIGRNGQRQQAAADVLLYESTLQAGFFLVVDNRYVNTNFLRAHLRRRYRFRWNWTQGQPTFELLEWTGRNRRPDARAVPAGAATPVRWSPAVKIET